MAKSPGMRRDTSLPTIRRLPSYLRLLRTLRKDGRDWVSSAGIAAALTLEAIQVRKDLESIGVSGRPKRGYAVAELVAAIEAFLGWDNITDTFIVGAGNLGRALLGYDGFARHGISVIAGFDTDPAMIGARVNGKPIMALDKLSSLVQRMHVHLGILTVPPAAAQSTADLMVEAGITAIWNFSPVHLTVPPTVTVQDEDLGRGLAVLSVNWARAREAAGTDAGGGGARAVVGATRRNS